MTDRRWRCRVVVVALIVGAFALGMAASSPARAPRVLAPGDATEEQVRAALAEIERFLGAAEENQEIATQILRAVRCDYLPETEGC